MLHLVVALLKNWVGAYFVLLHHYVPLLITMIACLDIVYGKENVSSGASSDLRMASNVANSMIQVGPNSLSLRGGCLLTCIGIRSTALGLFG